MPELYFTPASISYLNEFLLALIITIYIGKRYLEWKNTQLRQQAGLLLIFFTSTTIFSLLLFLDASFLPAERLIVVYLENTILGILLVALIQFAYHFPVSNKKIKLESRIALVVSCAYALWEAVFAVQRFNFLRDGQVIFRQPNMDQAVVFEFVWVIFIFARSSFQNWKLPATRRFALIFLIPLWLAILNYFRLFYTVSTPFYNINMSIGLLFTTFFLALNYLTFQPERTSFVVKLSGAVLTSVLAVFGIIAWLVAPAYARQYTPSIVDHRTIHFIPNERGGYDVSDVLFRYEENIGQYLDLTELNSLHEVDFDFPFFGHPYKKLFVSHDGAIGIGSEFAWRDFQYHFVNAPMIFPLLVDVNPNPAPNTGVFLRQEAGQAIITYYKIQSQNHPNAIYTFQVVLFSDGSFDFTYNGLPDLKFYVDDRPEATAWAIGVKPVIAPQSSVNFTHLPLQGDSKGLLQDEYRSFRTYLHGFLMPLALAVLISSLLFLIGLPAVLNFVLAHPLNSLLDGVSQVESGDLSVEMPIVNWDEIGSLTASFNAMVLHLRSLINMLEGRVTERTRELQATNERLLIEIDDRVAAEARVIQQQRDLAAAEEREQMGRELHDGFGQVIGFVNVQAQAAQLLLDKGQIKEARGNLDRIVQAAQDAHIDLRHYIFGLRDATTPHRSFYGVLQESLRAFSETWNISTVFSPEQQTLPILPETVEDQLLHIIQESLVNIRKHARARRVEILSTSSSEETVFIISDDGRGFDPQTAPGTKEKHFGLSIMRERAEQIGGQLEIRSTIGQGTRVLVHIPHILASTSKDDLSDIQGLRILLVDDHPLFLDGLQNLLTARGFTVIGVAHDGVDAFDQVKALRPDVVLMDNEMPNRDGIEATRLIKAEFPATKVVILTVSADDKRLMEAIKYGASGYLLKSLDANQMFSALGRAVRSGAQIDPELASRLLTEFNRTPTTPRPAAFRADTIPAELTLRQWEVLRLVARGTTYKEAGGQLGLTERAIKYHMAQILERLHLQNRDQVVEYMRRFQDGRNKKGSE